ncbi:MAG: hypothetical protein IJ243_09510 [Prevotella sp.]|nr:hypothetical protein [Prevotella sp.]
MKETLFVNVKNPNLYSYFRLGDDWEKCFVVVFSVDKDNFDNLYWGNTSYVEPDRGIISMFLTSLYLPAPTDEWKKVSDMFLAQTEMIQERLNTIKHVIAEYNIKEKIYE